MRRFVTRPAVMLLTFCLGLALVLLYGGLVRRSVRQLAQRAGQRVAAPYVAEAERRHMNRRVLLDLRTYWEADSSARTDDLSYKEFDAMGREREEVKRRIHPKLFSKTPLAHYGLCSEESRARPARSEADLAWARDQGQFVAYVPDRRDGSFTQPGAFETLYVIDVGECNAREAPVPPSELLAVFDRWDGLHAAFDAFPGEGLYAVHDVDGDAVDEVLLGRGEMEGTQGVFTMRLVSLKEGRMRVVHEFGVAYVYSFSDHVGDERVITVPVIYYTPRGDGGTPAFEVDFYQATCSKSEGCGFVPRPHEWHYYKSGRLEESDYRKLPGLTLTLPQQ